MIGDRRVGVGVRAVVRRGMRWVGVRGMVARIGRAAVAMRSAGAVMRDLKRPVSGVRRGMVVVVKEGGKGREGKGRRAA